LALLAGRERSRAGCGVLLGDVELAEQERNVMMTDDAAVRRAALAQAQLERTHRRLVPEQAAVRPGAGTPLGLPYDEPSPRLRFVRWLVDTGRLSDWPDPE
jgi:hypothetical protein